MEKFLKKFERLLLLFLIVFLPTQLGKHFWPEFAFVLGIRVDYLAPTVYLTDILVLGILITWAWGKRDQLLTTSYKLLVRRYWSLFAIFLYLFLTSFLAQNQGAALWKFLKILEFFFLGLFVAKNQYMLHVTCYMLSWAIIYSSLIAIAQFFKQASLGGIFWWLGERTFNAGTPGVALAEWGERFLLRPYGTFSHPNSMSGFLLVALILIWGTSNVPPRLKIASTSLGLIALIFSFSRAAWLAGMLIGLWFMVNSLWSKKLQGRLVLLTMAVIGGFLFFFNLAEPTTQERIWLTKMAVQMIQAYPLIGVGLNNFVVYLPEFWLGGGRYLFQPVHNIFLLVAAETGLIGFMVFFWFLWLSFKRNIIYRQKYLLFSLLVILLTGFLDHYWLTLQQNMLLAAIVFGLVWSNPVRRGKIKT